MSSSSTEQYQALRAERDALTAQLKDVAKLAFREQSEALFAAHPGLQAFCWRQYTPYFNDGEPCVFSANTDSLTLRFAGDSEEDDEDDWWSRSYDPNWIKTPRDEAGLAIVAFLGSFSNEDYLEMFGDHVEVNVSRAGVDVQDYDHD